MFLKQFLNRNQEIVRAIDPYDTLIDTHLFLYDFIPDPIRQSMQKWLQEDKLRGARNKQSR